jgi:hypothetical protein
MVAYTRARPKLSALLLLEPCGQTRWQDVEGAVNLPWNLVFSRVDLAGYRVLRLVTDMQFMIDLQRECDTLGIEDIVVRRLDYAPTQLCELQVTKQGPSETLRNRELDELSSLRPTRAQAAHDDSVLELAGLREDARTGNDTVCRMRRRATVRARSQAQAPDDEAENVAGTLDAVDDTSRGSGDDDEHDEYVFERGLRAGAQAELQQLISHMDEEEAWADGMDEAADSFAGNEIGLPVVAATRSRAQKAGAKRRARQKPNNWAAFEAHITVHPTNPRYKNVSDDDGNVVGQLQPLINASGYRCFALCLHPHHLNRCSRSRGWRPSGDEDPNMVDRVLARWLLEGADLTSTREHMSAARY